MNIQELRIGNYVYYNGIAMRIAGIDSPKPRKNKQFDDEYVIELQYNGLIDTTLEYISPISITNEILNKTNFSRHIKQFANDAEYYYYNLSEDNFCDLTLITHLYDDDLCRLGLFPYERWFTFQYVHELQNIFFDLMKEELKFNLLIIK